MPNVSRAAPKRPEYADRPFQASFAGRRLRPYADNVLVLFDYIRDARGEHVAPSGLIIPSTASVPEMSESVLATVVAVGPGRWDDKWLGQELGTAHIGSKKWIASELKAGDRVLIRNQLCGDAVMIDGLEHRVVRETDAVLGVVEE